VLKIEVLRIKTAVREIWKSLLHTDSLSPAAC